MAKKNITDSAPETEALPNEFQKEDYICCRCCGHIDLCENFPFMDPPDEPFREKYCPKCRQDDMINLSNIPICEGCWDCTGVDQCQNCPILKNWVRQQPR